MTEDAKIFLKNLIEILQEGFKTIDDRCNVDLEWETDELRMLKEKLDD